MTGPITVERLSFGGRTLVDSRDAGGGRLAGWPEVAREAVRAICHLTVDDPLPAPTLYRILGDLKGVAAAQLGELLEAAQTAIAEQGYRTDEDNDGDERS